MMSLGLQLAMLHSMAVDYVKTGEPAEMRQDLRPRKWPHFMERRFKPKDQTYVSQKVLGKLYDMVERVDFVPAFSAPFDQRVLDAYDLSEDLLRGAEELKIQYDAAMLRIMAQHEIRTEFEVWTTFVLHHVGDSKDFKFHEVIGELSTALKFQFREACYKKAGGKEYEHIAPFVAAMYKVTSDQVAQAVKECHEVRTVGGEETTVRKMVPANMPLMSFPWLFQAILGMIAQSIELRPGQRDDTNTQGHRRPKLTKDHVESFSLDDDILETHEGFTHRGEVLELFENPETTPGVKMDPYASLGLFGPPEESNVTPEIKSHSNDPSSATHHRHEVPKISHKISEPSIASPVRGYHPEDPLCIFGDPDEPIMVPENKSNSIIERLVEVPELSTKHDKPTLSSEIIANPCGDLLGSFEDPDESTVAPETKPSLFSNSIIHPRAELEPSDALQTNTTPNGDLFDLFGYLDEPRFPKEVETKSSTNHEGLFMPLEIPDNPSACVKFRISPAISHHEELLGFFGNPENPSFHPDVGMNPDFSDTTSHHDDVVKLFNNLDESLIDSEAERDLANEVALEAQHTPSGRLANGNDAGEGKSDNSHTNGVTGVKKGGDNLAGLRSEGGGGDRRSSWAGLDSLNRVKEEMDEDDGAEEVQLILDSSRMDAYSRLENLMSADA